MYHELDNYRRSIDDRNGKNSFLGLLSDCATFDLFYQYSPL